MERLRRAWIVRIAAVACALILPSRAGELEIAPGPFQPNWPSLAQYECPEWFRDAKFGIWAHWSAQCVPEQGDWYARRMYEPKDSAYKFHVETYGHPSKVGFKEICNLWKAEKWDPERLIALYKRAGAKYFVALANHHCNFDCWDSTYQAWNSVKVGPHKDIVGTWARAARAQGLRFGVTVHNARSWDWYDVAHGSDPDGPMKGIPYDGALTKADGKGLWWEGLDPADLYGPHGAARMAETRRAYQVTWFKRTKDLVDKYRPDLLYFDDGNLPLGDSGLAIAAHYYNANLAWHGGKQEAILNIKGMPAGFRKAVILDIERGRSDRMEEFPWQTDTCIGEWHYHRGIRYASARDVIHQLVDIVSKNGNLLLNIPVRGDGTIDDDEVKLLEEMAAWIAVNGEAIYSTRPWKLYGEGPRRGRRSNYGARDIRFTTEGEALYAFALGWPEDGKLLIRSLAKPSDGGGNAISGIRLLGHAGDVAWSQSTEGLSVSLPEKRPCDHAFAFRIAGKDLAPIPFQDPALVIRATADGSLRLDAESADLHGSQVRVEEIGGQPNVGFWDLPQEWLSWKAAFAGPGRYEVQALCATPHRGSEIVLRLAGAEVAATVPTTRDFSDFRPLRIGVVEVKAAGEETIEIRPRDAKTWKAINLRWIEFKKRP